MVQQTITVFQVLQFIAIIVAIVGGLFAISRQIKKDKEKYATKDYVNLELKNMNTKIDSIEKDVSDDKQQNLREHDSIKVEFNNTIKALDNKFDTVISLLKGKAG